MDKISQAQSQIQSVKNQIETALAKLDRMDCAIRGEEQQTAARRDDLVVQAQVW